jgi:hypothetical protein
MSKQPKSVQRAISKALDYYWKSVLESNGN